MSTAIIIPARYASTRYPGKPLALLRGANGAAKTLLARSYAAAQKAAEGQDCAVYIATDDARIADHARALGAAVIMTSTGCRNGTERVAEAVEVAGITAEIIVNLQGDAPLTPPHFVRELIGEMRADPAVHLATPRLLCEDEMLRNLLADRAAGRVGGTTVVTDQRGYALYFSKEVLPFTNGGAIATPVYHHVGLYAYRPAMLRAYIQWPPSPLEVAEGLEQLRFLENGQGMRCVTVAAKGAAFWELNNPSDVPLIEAYLARMGWD